MSASRSGNGRPATHLLMYPYPAAGHIIPMLDLAQTLLLYPKSKNQIIITILVTESNLHLLNPLLSLFPSSFNHLLLPSPPSPLHRHLTSIITTNCINLPHIETWFNSHPSPPIAIVSDFFLGWTQPLAVKLGIKRIVFSPSGAFALSVMNSIWSQPVNNNTVDPPDDSIVEFLDVPGSPAFLWWQLSPIYRRAATVDCDNQDWKLFRESWLQNLESYGTIVNAFAGLESKYIDHLNSVDHRVWAVGPLLPDDSKAPDRGGASALPSDEVKTWLDLKSADREHSVVFVCFGSQCALSKKQLHVITEAFDRSGVSFILSVRSYDGNHSNQVAMDDLGEVPEDYESRVSGRGLVIRGWAPQVAILNHRAVGAFVTHCGWNSVLEGLSAGVVMLTWPMSADQFTNAKLLVDQAGVGIRVGESTRVIPEVNELVKVLVKSVDPNRVERKRALEIKSAARAAVVMGGSSDRDLDDLIAQLSQLRRSV